MLPNKEHAERQRLKRLAKQSIKTEQTMAQAYNVGSRTLAKQEKRLALSTDKSNEAKKERLRMAQVWEGNKALKPTGFYLRKKNGEKLAPLHKC